MRRRFRYLVDPAFLICVFVYFVNRFLESQGHGFYLATFYLNDLICFAFWMPILVLLLRVLGWRNHDEPPTRREAIIAFAVWATMFEVWLPTTAMFSGLAISDPWDVVCYAVGGAGVILWWEWFYQSSRFETSSGL